MFLYFFKLSICRYLLDLVVLNYHFPEYAISGNFNLKPNQTYQVCQNPDYVVSQLVVLTGLPPFCSRNAIFVADKSFFTWFTKIEPLVTWFTFSMSMARPQQNVAFCPQKTAYPPRKTAFP